MSNDDDDDDDDDYTSLYNNKGRWRKGERVI